MHSSEYILKLLRKEKVRLRSLGVTDIGLFGSYLRGEAKKKSDIDILINISEDSPLTLFSLIELEQNLSEKLNKQVDLVIKRDLKPGIGETILNEVKYA
ncbi:MAG TPA: nucleotidyltransferase family protein [Spirochaetota bacterium]|nr:nucleotidyltransferase family protein [Spirochaetota bacterium]